jgi:predicted amidohydrolase YtcJ
VTTIQDMTTEPATSCARIQSLRAAGHLPVRITSHQNRDIDSLVAAGIESGFGDDWLRLGGVKLFADGRWDRERRRSSNRTPTIRPLRAY